MNYKNRKHPRLKDYDYRMTGAYFITVCTIDRAPILGTILPSAEGEAAKNCLSAFGAITDAEVRALPQRYPYVQIEHSVVMPNHVHLLISVMDTVTKEQRIAIPQIVGVWKSRVTQLCKAHGYSGKRIFQQSFYEHVVRDERDYQKIWTYIEDNPQKWATDCYYTD